jgi:hypothetical protein
VRKVTRRRKIESKGCEGKEGGGGIGGGRQEEKKLKRKVTRKLGKMRG